MACKTSSGIPLLILENCPPSHSPVHVIREIVTCSLAGPSDRDSGSTSMNQQPKALTFLLTLPFLPRTRAAMLPYLFVGTATALVLHAISPRRVVVPLSVSEQAVVLMNLLLTLASALV